MPYSTARNRILGLKMGSLGAPTKFSAVEEWKMPEFLMCCADLGIFYANDNSAPSIAD